MIENSDGLEFLQLLFDYMRRKYDHHDKGHEHAAAAIAYTRHLSSAQLYHFQRICDVWIPGGGYNIRTGQEDVIQSTDEVVKDVA